MLHRQTTRPELFQILEKLMQEPLLYPFRLVGGTALSLWKGHRLSVDIDLFTDQQYGTTNFRAIEEWIENSFPVVDNPYRGLPILETLENNNGLNLHIGWDPDHLVKTDIIYWDPPFLFDPMTIEGIRLATVEEIGAMKLDVISRGGRKKDFWDLVEIMEDISLPVLREIYTSKYLYNDWQDVLAGLTNFEEAEKVPDPICLRGRNWREIKQLFRKEAAKLEQDKQ